MNKCLSDVFPVDDVYSVKTIMDALKCLESELFEGFFESTMVLWRPQSRDSRKKTSSRGDAISKELTRLSVIVNGSIALLIFKIPQ
jgi:hypothetical protein